MSLSIDQLFLSPNEENKIQLQNRPYIGNHDSSEECSDEDKVKLPQMNHCRRSMNYSKNDSVRNENQRSDQKIETNSTRTDYSVRQESANNKNETHHRTNNRTAYTQYINQTLINQSDYAASCSNQNIIRNKNKEMSNLNYPANLAANYTKQCQQSSTTKQNDRIKYRKNCYNNYGDDYESSFGQTDDLLALNNDLEPNEIKNSDNDLTNRKPANALIKRGNLLKNIDYFNKTNSIVEPLDDDLYGKRRKGRKIGTQNLQDILQPEVEYVKKEFTSKEYLNNKDGQLMIDNRARDYTTIRIADRQLLNETYGSNAHRMRFVNKNGNYHYLQKDANSKKASFSSTDISIAKDETQSSSSSDSPTQDHKTEFDEITCFENKYIGFDLETVIRGNLNQKNSKELVYSSANSSILDDDMMLDNRPVSLANKLKNNKSNTSNSSQKLSALNDLLTIENDDSNKNPTTIINNDHDMFMSVDFSSSIMHKSTTKQFKHSTDRKNSIEKDVAPLVDLTNNSEVSDKYREFSPELLKFNEDYERDQFVNRRSGDLLTDDINCSNSSFKDTQDQQPVIQMISSAQSVLQPKIINTGLIENSNKSHAPESNDQENREVDVRENLIINLDNNNDNNQNNLMDEIELDEERDDGIGSDRSDQADQNDGAFAKMPMKVDERNRRSSSESCSSKEYKRQLTHDYKEQSNVIYSNALVGSQLDSSTSSESTFNSNAMISKSSNVPGTSSSNRQRDANGMNNELTSSVASFEGSSPKINGLRTPGYTQRILNTNSKTEQVKYGLFQLGTNNVSNNLIDIDTEHKDDLREDEMNGNENFVEKGQSSYKAAQHQNGQKSQQQSNNQHISSIKRDISRDELVKSILNIPFSKYDIDHNQDEDNLNEINRTSISQPSILNSGHINKLSYVNRAADSEQKLQQITTNDLESLGDNKSVQHSVTNRNESLDNMRLNSSAGKQLKESSSNSSVINKSNLKISQQDSNASLEESLNFRNSGSGLMNNNNLKNFDIDKQQQDPSDCLDSVLDKSLTNNINFVSNSMSNLNLSNKKSINKLSNGRLMDYIMDEDAVIATANNKMDMGSSNQVNLIDNDSKEDKKDEIETSTMINNVIKSEDENNKEQLLIDTSDIITCTNQTTNFNDKYDKQNYVKKESSFGQHKLHSKILQDTVSNHLLNESLIDITDDPFNTIPYEHQTSNKRSPKKHKSNYNTDLCYSDNNSHIQNRITDRNYYSRNILNSKYIAHQINHKTSEDSMHNFSLSPETTDCDSVEVESEFSISSFVSLPGLNQMPILADGLSSSGSDSDDDETTQPTKLDNNDRTKKCNQSNKHINSAESPEIFAKCRPRVKKNQHMSDYDLNHHSERYNCENQSSDSNLCGNSRPSDGRHIKKSRSLNLNNNIHMSNGLDSSEAEHPNDNLSTEQMWNSKLQQQQQQQSRQPQQQPNRGHLDYNQSINCGNQSDNEAVSNSLLKLSDDKPKLIEKTFHEDVMSCSSEDCDTDTETDRLLGAQRSEDRSYYEDKNQPIKKKSNSKEGTKIKRPSLSRSVLIEGVLFRARYLGSTQLICEGQPNKNTRMLQAEEAVSRIKSLVPDGESQPSTEVDLFISTEKIMVLNTDLKEIVMDHSLRTISYIADIGDLLVLMARRRLNLNENNLQNNVADKIKRTAPKMICHVFESEEAQFIAQSIGQAFQVAYIEFLKANGIEDSSFVKDMDYQEVLSSQQIFGNELEMFARKEKKKEVVVPKKKGEILGMVIVESGWGSMLPTVVIANMAQQLPAARCGALNIGDQIIAINGISLVGLPLATCQNYIKNTKNQTVVKFNVVPCAPVVEVRIKRPDTKYQLGFSVQNGVICSLLRGGIAERGCVRVGHRIIEINQQSVVAVPHEKIVNLLATSVGMIHMKTMPTSMFRLLTGQEIPVFI